MHAHAHIHTHTHTYTHTHVRTHACTHARTHAQVVDKGELKEFDNPYALLQRRTMFKGMVEQTGPSAADKLFQMAKEAHTMRKRAI